MSKLDPQDKQVVVWHLLSNRWYSAISAYALNSALALNNKKFKSVISVCKSSIAAPKVNPSLKQYPVNSFSIFNLFVVVKIFWQIKPKVMIAYGGPEFFLAQLIKLFYPKIEILRFWGDWRPNQEKKFIFKFIKMNLYNPCKFARLVVPGKAIQKNMKRFLKLESVVIPYGADEQKFFPMNVARKPKAIILGRLDPIKGHKEFLMFWHKMLEKIKTKEFSPCLEIIGLEANTPRKEIVDYAKELGLCEGEDFSIQVGQQLDLVKKMNEACLGVIPSLGSEWIGRVGEEFLLCGVPILVSGVGNLADLVEEPIFGTNLAEAKTDEQKCQAACELFLRGWQESFEVKNIRANKAKAIWSKEAMGESWSKIVQP